MCHLMKIAPRCAVANPPTDGALRNTAIGLLRGEGYTNIASACRHMAAQPVKALAIVGIVCENCIALLRTVHTLRAASLIL